MPGLEACRTGIHDGRRPATSVYGSVMLNEAVVEVGFLEGNAAARREAKQGQSGSRARGHTDTLTPEAEMMAGTCQCGRTRRGAQYSVVTAGRRRRPRVVVFRLND